MANTQLTIDQITKEGLRVLVNQLGFTKHVNRDYDDSYAVSGAKIGDTLRIRKPARYKGRSGAALSVEDHTEKKEDLKLTTQFGVDAEWTSKETTLELDEFSDRHLRPAMATIANKIDYDGLGLYQSVGNQVGAPGTPPATALIVLQNGQKLSEDATPKKDQLRTLVVNPEAEANIIDSLKGLFNPGKTIADQFRDGSMGRALGYKWEMDQNVRVHTTGTFTSGSTPLTNGAGQVGASLVTDGWAVSTAIFKKGDTFTLTGILAVNPQSRASTGAERQFVVTADVTSDGSGNATIPIFPAIQPATSQFATVLAAPADGVAIVPVGTEDTAYPINLGFHRDAFVLGTADLMVPQGTHSAHREVHEGISMRIVQDYDIKTDIFATRIDVLYGWKTVYGELACRLIG